MKDKKTEKKLFDAADSSTQGAPSFESFEKKVDWEETANKTKKGGNTKLVPALIIGLSGILVIAGTVTSIVFFSSHRTDPTPSASGTPRPPSPGATSEQKTSEQASSAALNQESIKSLQIF